MPKQRQAGIHLYKTIAPNYETGKHEYYWILVARNGKTIARSSETYKRKAGAAGSIRTTAKILKASFGLFGGHFFDHTGKNSKVDAYNF